MRLFIALDIDSSIRQRIATFVDGVRGFAPDVRFVGPESFHITLKFLGETEKIEAIRSALKEIRGQPIALNFRGYGFFPGPMNPRVF